MEYIEAASDAMLDKPRLQKQIALAEELGIADKQFFEVMAHAPNYAEALFQAMYQAHINGGVDVRLKEVIRIQLARLAGDKYSASLRSKRAIRLGLTEELIEVACADYENEPRFTDAHKWAMRYGYLMYREPEKVDNEFYEEGKTHFTEAQIMELGNFMTINYGMATFFRTLDLTPLDPDT
jgi:alkylhydroperoxidase family enzyme